MFKLCAFADESSPAFVGQIDALKRNEIPYLEIRGVDGDNIKDVTPARARELRRMLDDAGLAVWSMGSPIGKLHLEDDFAPHMDDHKRILELCDILGASRVRMFSFYPLVETDDERSHEMIWDYLDRLCDATPESVILCHENEKKIYGETPEKCVEIHKAFPRIRAVFDPANFIHCGVNTLKAWEMMEEYVDYMHIKDANADGIIVPAGQGIGNIPEILPRYAARGGEVLTLEPHLKVFKGLDKLEDGGSIKQGTVVYETSEQAFDTAVNALKSVIRDIK